MCLGQTNLAQHQVRPGWGLALGGKGSSPAVGFPFIYMRRADKSFHDGPVPVLVPVTSKSSRRSSEESTTIIPVS